MGLRKPIYRGGGGAYGKPIYREGLPKKGRLGQFANLRRGLARKRGWCFWGEGIDTPMHPMIDQDVKHVSKS